MNRDSPNKKTQMTNRMGATESAAPGWANRMMTNTTRNPPPRAIPSCLTTTELVITGIWAVQTIESDDDCSEIDTGFPHSWQNALSGGRSDPQ
ncbi:MAG: hypothetical protein BWY45_02487 [Euryarchaeota archaeon ADurb.Bin294]|nr:MAG: hypothetical protein BWY45_02487 [Euryarchaeota archaeon ADurb.Bin294]